MSHDWPGNVRELGNVVERAITLTTSPLIGAAEFDLIFSLGKPAAARRMPAEPPRAQLAPPPGSPEPPLAGGDEQERILRALEGHGWNHTKAAESLGIARNTLWRRMKQLGIERPG